jgi:hypothetical protein
VNERLTFVLPVALHETGLVPDDRPQWRHSPDKGTPLRTRYLLCSFLKYFNQESLHEFLIICPSSDVTKLNSLLRSITADPRYFVIEEDNICPDVYRATSRTSGEVFGWRAQQLIKLAVSRRCSSEHYVTLDNDVICVKQFHYASLVRNGMAATNCERPCDYERLYTDKFALAETKKKAARYSQSASLLGYVRPSASRYLFYGETPVILNTKSVIELTQCLDKRFGRSWSQALAETGGWTEYSLYYQFLEMTGQQEKVCQMEGCNAVLDLEKSVWQESSRYRSCRTYDAKHFLAGGRDRGPFVAIQSWLPISSWLPSRCRSLAEFYDEVKGWVL